ncbi:MAG: beta-ketoacyl-[acyl-carrier-protein] synthase family protein [Terrimicrobiaceae bacterium]
MADLRTTTLRRVVVTGMGFITSLGNDKSSVLSSLREGKTGIRPFEEFDRPDSPVRLAGTIQGFHFPSPDVQTWTIPEGYDLSREQRKSMAPHSVYAYCAMQQAIKEANLPHDLVSNARTGAMCASAGSPWLMYTNLHEMQSRGVMRCHPMGMVSCIPGTLNINLAALFQLKGSTLGFASACSSSAHALGHGFDLIQSHKQDIVFAVGAEDCHVFTGLPFAALRALSTQTDPALAPRAFDRDRDGFVFTGGSTALVLEEFEHAKQRGARVIAEVLGWGESSDGYHVMAPDPAGEGLSRAMENALVAAHVTNRDIDYINAHATSTVAGDVAELRAIKRTFGSGKIPDVSSTKSLTGHGLCMAGALESAISCLAIENAFTPISANITHLDPACEGIPVITKPVNHAPVTVMSNSSGFGGSNVAVIFGKPCG